MSASDDHFDSEADETIFSCLNLQNPRSFFLYAGAGSGKTRSLVEAIRRVCRTQGSHLSISGRKIGVITYTNAASDEIKQRLEFDPRVEVSTIHAFAWSLISGYDADIRQWVAKTLLEDIAELEAAQAKGKSGSKAAGDRARSIESKQLRHTALDTVARFVYSPVGDNRTRDALSHTEVLSITADFLLTKRGLRRLLVARFPMLLIDESQDTNGKLMDALLDVAAEHHETFCIGLFGDTMQRIYADGKIRLGDAIPRTWARPRKRMNHRCPTRVVGLINRIRQDDDGQEQIPRSDASAGVVRLFVVPQTYSNNSRTETAIAARMAMITGDQNWAAGSGAIKTLALEHLMSARRFGFERFFEPLCSIPSMRTSFLQGEGAGIGLFTREILPLVTALRASDSFAAAAIVRRTSPLLSHSALEAAGEGQRDLLATARMACEGLLNLASRKDTPTGREILIHVATTRLFTIPDALVPFATADTSTVDDTNLNIEAGVEVEKMEEGVSELGAWRQALDAPFDQIEKYDRYVRGVSQFDTHQGVKGLEFPRVMVIVSDDEARGFMFAYDKLFGTKGKSKTDLENETAGAETSIDRTRRLFYVTCSRAEEGLAVVYYAQDPVRARDAMIGQGWFKSEEIELFV